MNALAPALYLVACLVLFWVSVNFEMPPMRRVKFYFLAFASMCFGSGRLLYNIAPDDLPTYEWIFDLAHLSLNIFVGLYAYGAVTTWRARRR